MFKFFEFTAKVFNFSFSAAQPVYKYDEAGHKGEFLFARWNN